YEKKPECDAERIHRNRIAARGKQRTDQGCRADDHGEAEVVRIAPRQAVRIHHAQPDVRQHADVRAKQDEGDQPEDESKERDVSHGRCTPAARTENAAGAVMPSRRPARCWAARSGRGTATGSSRAALAVRSVAPGSWSRPPLCRNDQDIE